MRNSVGVIALVAWGLIGAVLGTEPRHDPGQRKVSRSTRSSPSRSVGRPRWQNRGPRQHGRRSEACRAGDPHHRSPGSNRHSRPDRFSHACDPCCSQLQHRGELDRRVLADRGPGPDQQRGAHDEAGRLADRCRRVERAAIQGESPADPGGARGCGAEQSGLRATGLRLGDDDARSVQGVEHHERGGPAAGGRMEKDAERQARPAAISGGQDAIIALFDRLPKPTFDQQVEGTKEVLPRAESAGRDRCGRSWRQQHRRRTIIRRCSRSGGRAR